MPDRTEDSSVDHVSSGFAKIEAICRAHFNEPALDFPEVVRLIGYGETAVDRYYILRSPSRGVYWMSAVGSPIFLDQLRGQGQIVAHNGEVWDDFVRLDLWLTYNRVPKAEAFVRDVRPDDHEIGGVGLSEADRGEDEE